MQALCSVLCACDVAADHASKSWDVTLADAADGTRDVSRHSAIRLQFDRRLSPWSVGRSSISVVSGDIGEFVFPSFDPVTQQLSIRPARSLIAGLNYVVTLDGLVDLDGNALAEPMRLLVRAADIEPPPAREPVTFAEVAPLLTQRCASAACHDANTRAGAVDLSSADAIAETVRDRPSLQAASPNVGNHQLASSGLFDLPVVDGQGTPASVSRSYLIYKVLGDPHVLGEAMPPDAALDANDIALLADWIATGAALD